MKKYFLGLGMFGCAVAFCYGAVYLLWADEVTTLEELYELARTRPDMALETLPTLIEADPELMVRCHEITHQIGHVAYAAQKDLAFEITSPVCGAGYLHGALEEAVTFDGLDSLSERVHEMCKEDQLESCLHGLGHAIVQITPDIPAAVLLCKEISTLDTDCYDGVFMEKFDSESAPVTISYTDGVTTCLEMNTEVKPSCYFYVPRIIKDFTPREVATACSALPTSANVICAEGSGVMFMKYEPGFNKDIALTSCEVYTDSNMRLACIGGVTKYSQFGSIENTRWE
jgi:hypothetical protein